MAGPTAPPRSRSLASGMAVALLTTLLLIPAASVADPAPSQTRPASKTLTDPASSVSMSPRPVGSRPNTSTALTPLEGDQTVRPLTRAAAQLRVETMSPADWLAGFGDVTIGRIAPSKSE